MIGLRIWNRHRQAACLQQPWPFRIALPTSEVALSSGTPPWQGDSVQRVQIGEPFGPSLNCYPGRLAGRDRPLPFIHLIVDRQYKLVENFVYEIPRSSHANRIVECACRIGRLLKEVLPGLRSVFAQRQTRKRAGSDQETVFGHVNDRRSTMKQRMPS